MSRMNDGVHIPTIVDRVTCNVHHRDKGEPCWYVLSDAFQGTMGFAVCGKRILAAGFNGEITASSLQLRAPGGRADSRAKRRTNNHK